MKILMIGATGNFAKNIIPALKKKDIVVKAIVRNKSKIEIALQNGVDETVIADLNNIDSLRNALQGVDGVFHINPVFDENEVDLALNMVKAAKEVNVEKIVFSSVYHPSLSLGNHASKRPVEEAIYESGLNFVILQPAMFMQTIETMWNVISQTKKIGLPYSCSSKMSYVDYRDVAEVASIAFTTNRLDNGTFELASQGTYSREHIAQLLNRITGSGFEAVEIDFESFANALGIPEGFQKDAMKAMFTHYNKYGFNGGNSLVLETILGRKPTSLETFFKDLLKRQQYKSTNI